MENKATYEELELQIAALKQQIDTVSASKSVFDTLELARLKEENGKKFKRLIWDMRVGVLVQRANAEIVLSNPAALELLGLSEDQLIGKTSFDPSWNVIHEDGSPFPGDTHPVPVSIATRKAVRNVIMGVYHPLDNDRVWLLVDAIPHIIVDGKVQEVVCTFIDISSRKKAELALKESENQLKELNATKDKLFSIIAHDLRSPFNTILGFSDLLHKNIEKYDTEKIKKFAEQINHSTKQTLTLLENLLNWAKSQTGQISFSPENIHLETIVDYARVNLNVVAEIKKVSLNYFQTESIEVYADSNMLLTILRNLISNAIKFSHAGGNIDIYAISNPNEVEITISDNGIGMNQETIDKLFRLDTYITTLGTNNEKGSGLGLMLCKEFVEKHGGKIWVESVLGNGSNFIFTIPLCKV